MKLYYNYIYSDNEVIEDLFNFLKSDPHFEILYCYDIRIQENYDFKEDFNIRFFQSSYITTTDNHTLNTLEEALMHCFGYERCKRSLEDFNENIKPYKRDQKLSKLGI